MNGKMWLNIRIAAIVLVCMMTCLPCSRAQELNAKVSINHSQVQGTDASVFDALQKNLQQFINDQQWTDLQFKKLEKISCAFNITVSKYDKTTGRFEATATIQASRPVYRSTYTSTIYNKQDADFSFDFKEYDQLNFQPEIIDNQLMALTAYYAYLIIGLDLDTFAPMGGTDVLKRCLQLVNDAQSLGFPGWKAFTDDRNRFAFISDYMDESMSPLRQLQYDYYRKGLDDMVANGERGRGTITAALNKLKEAHGNRPQSLLPQIWTDFKRDELVSIYQGHGTQQEQENVSELLMGINASQSDAWNKIKEHSF